MYLCLLVLNISIQPIQLGVMNEPSLANNLKLDVDHSSSVCFVVFP